MADEKKEDIKEIVSRFKEEEEWEPVPKKAPGAPPPAPGKAHVRGNVLDSYSFLSENIPVEITIEMKGDFVPFYSVTIPGIAGGIAPLIGGWMAGAVSYQSMFILAAVKE